MSNLVSAVQDEPKGSVDPARILHKAYINTKAKGSSTAYIIMLTNQVLLNVEQYMYVTCMVSQHVDYNKLYIVIVLIFIDIIIIICFV